MLYLKIEEKDEYLLQITKHLRDNPCRISQDVKFRIPKLEVIRLSSQEFQQASKKDLGFVKGAIQKSLRLHVLKLKPTDKLIRKWQKKFKNYD